jgi:hypothetical protein
MENRKLISELQFCAGQCSRCYDACLMQNDTEKLRLCMYLTEDCAEICRLTASLLDRNSPNAELFLKLCSDTCRVCAEECQKVASVQSLKCADTCLKCEEVCLSHQPVI